MWYKTPVGGLAQELSIKSSAHQNYVGDDGTDGAAAGII